MRLWENNIERQSSGRREKTGHEMEKREWKGKINENRDRK